MRGFNSFSVVANLLHFVVLIKPSLVVFYYCLEYQIWRATSVKFEVHQHRSQALSTSFPLKILGKGRREILGTRFKVGKSDDSLTHCAVTRARYKLATITEL